jgi:transcription elongation factor Elf1
MRDYNVQDVELLYKVYHQIKHFDNKAPNMATYYQDDKERCPVCGSEHVELTGNTILTNLSKFEEVHCTSCGARSRKRTNLLEKDKRKSLLSN